MVNLHVMNGNACSYTDYLEIAAMDVTVLPGYFKSPTLFLHLSYVITGLRISEHDTGNNDSSSLEWGRWYL